MNRRALALGALSLPFTALVRTAGAQDEFFGVPTNELSTPDEINPLQLYGSSPPSAEEEAKARQIIRAAPTGPRPIDIARYFVSDHVEQHYREQWPRNASWNPVIVEFFRATGFRASNDMVAWCAAFVNWCLVQANRPGSGSAASQDFLDPRKFAAPRTNDPREGDLAVFTCHRESDDVAIGLGHVAFVGAPPRDEVIPCLGGNQSVQGSSSIISEVPFPKTSRVFQRCVATSNGACTSRVSVRLKHAAYFRIS